MAAFILKVFAGFAYGYLYAHYFPNSDSWMLFEESLKEYHYLLHEPARFFSTEVEFRNMTDVFSHADNATWKNLDDNIFIKILGILNLLSFGNYYVNVILFNFFSTWGLYRIYMAAVPYTRNKLLLSILVFALPSSLFWSSGLHKDGMIVFFTGIFIAGLQQQISRGFTWKGLLLLLVCLLGLLTFRNAAALVLVMPSLAWYASKYLPWKPIVVFSASLILGVIFFFSTSILPDKYNLPQLLAEKQGQFLKLEGGSKVETTALKGNLLSYFKAFPKALNRVFLRPYPTELQSPFYLMAFAEMLLVMTLIVIALLRIQKIDPPRVLHPFNLFLLSTAITSLLIIGFTVPFLGAIVRYKSFYLVLLLVPFLQITSRYSRIHKN